MARKNLISTAARATKFLSQTGVIARRYETNSLMVLWRASRLFFEKGFMPWEAALWGLLGPTLPKGLWEASVGKRRLFQLQARVNPKEFRKFTEDKALFYIYCAGLGLPIPVLYGVFDKPVGWKADGTFLTKRSEWESFFEKDVPDEFVLKPAKGVYGRHLHVYRRISSGFRDSSGTNMTASQIVDLISSNPRYRKFVIQERLKGHPELARLSNTPFLQTVRLTTFVNGNGEAGVYGAALKVIAGNSPADNFDCGSTGNLMCDIDIDNGTLGDAVSTAPDGLGIIALERHPKTDTVFRGQPVPMWKQSLCLVTKAAILFLPLRTIGWDVAITPEGPVLIEGNVWYDPCSDVLPIPANKVTAWLYAKDLLRLIKEKY